MRCKKHPTDLSSAVGVCASCLRERLFAIISAQSQSQFSPAQQDCRNSDAQLPPPLSFHRSVSPYVSRRKSDAAAAAAWQLQGQQQRFHATPQVGPTGSVLVDMKKNGKSYGGRFSLMFQGLFRSNSEKPGSEPGPLSDQVASVDSPLASPSWLSSILSGRREKSIRSSSVDESITGVKQKARRNRDRGMSPARCHDEDDEHCRSSGYSSESSQGWRQTPRRTPAASRLGGGVAAGHHRYMSGLAFCLSPLVRPSPSRHWNQRAPPETLLAGESRVPSKPYKSAAASLCKSRSRKLAEFGRYSCAPHY